MRMRVVARSGNSTLVLTLLAILYSFVCLERWLVTDLGLLSFGRVWHLYVSYIDFGFVRRALLGTVLSLTRINSLFGNEYIFGLFSHHLLIVVLTCLVAVYIVRYTNVDFITQ